MKKFLQWNIGLCLLMIMLVGCGGLQRKRLMGPQSINIEHRDLVKRILDADAATPKDFLAYGINSWNEKEFRNAGDYFIKGYKTGKSRGYRWMTDAKIRILGDALRAYFWAGDVTKETETANYLIDELSENEKKLVPSDLKVLIYWATMSSETPYYENDVPQSVRFTP